MPIINGVEVSGLIPGSVESEEASPTAHHHCDVSSQQCCPALQQAQPLDTRFAVMWRVQ